MRKAEAQRVWGISAKLLGSGKRRTRGHTLQTWGHIRLWFGGRNCCFVTPGASGMFVLAQSQFVYKEESIVPGNTILAGINIYTHTYIKSYNTWFITCQWIINGWSRSFWVQPGVQSLSTTKKETEKEAAPELMCHSHQSGGSVERIGNLGPDGSALKIPLYHDHVTSGFPVWVTPFVYWGNKTHLWGWDNTQKR